MKYAPEFFAFPTDVTEWLCYGIVVYTANGHFADKSPSFCVMMVL